MVSVEAIDERGSENVLVTRLEGTLRYEERLPRVEMEFRSGQVVSKQAPEGVAQESANDTHLDCERLRAGGRSAGRPDASSH